MSKFIFKSINFLLEFLDRSFSKFCSSLSLLQLGCKRLDLLLVAGLSLVGFVLRNFKGFQVSSNNPQFFLKFNNLHLSCFCSLFSSLKLSLNLLESLLNLFILLISFFSLVSGGLKFLLQFGHSFLILDSSVFQNLPHSVRVISSSSSLVKFICSLKKFILTLLKI